MSPLWDKRILAVNWSFLKNPLKFKLVHCIKQVHVHFPRVDHDSFVSLNTRGKKEEKKGRNKAVFAARTCTYRVWPLGLTAAAGKDNRCALLSLTGKQCFRIPPISPQ